MSRMLAFTRLTRVLDWATANFSVWLRASVGRERACTHEATPAQIKIQNSQIKIAPLPRSAPAG